MKTKMASPTRNPTPSWRPRTPPCRRDILFGATALLTPDLPLFERPAVAATPAESMASLVSLAEIYRRDPVAALHSALNTVRQTPATELRRDAQTIVLSDFASPRAGLRMTP